MDEICILFEYQIGFAGYKEKLGFRQVFGFSRLMTYLEMKIIFSSIYAHLLFLCLPVLVWGFKMMMIMVPVDMPVCVSLVFHCFTDAG